MQVKDHRRLARQVEIKGLSHRTIAKALGWNSHTYVGRILRGEITTMDPRAAVYLCHLLEVAVDDFFLTKSSKNPGQVVRGEAA